MVRRERGLGEISPETEIRIHDLHLADFEQVFVSLHDFASRDPFDVERASPPLRQRAGESGKYDIIDLDLARYDRIAQASCDAILEAAGVYKGRS